MTVLSELRTAGRGSGSCWGLWWAALWASLCWPASVGLAFPEAGSSNGDQHICPPPGKVIWTLNPSSLLNGTLAAPAVVLPDLDEDGVRDLVVLAIGDMQVGSDVAFIFCRECFRFSHFCSLCSASS